MYGITRLKHVEICLITYVYNIFNLIKKGYLSWLLIKAPLIQGVDTKVISHQGDKKDIFKNIFLKPPMDRESILLK